MFHGRQILIYQAKVGGCEHRSDDGRTSSSKVQAIFVKGTIVSYQLRYGTVDTHLTVIFQRQKLEIRRRPAGQNSGRSELM